MIGRATMNISKEQMIAIVEHYLNNHLLNTTFHKEHTVKVVDQIRKTGDRFIIIFEGQQPLNAKRPQAEPLDLSRSATEADASF
jgi:hypothetical protein